MFIIWTSANTMDGGSVFPPPKKKTTQQTRLNLAAAAFTGVTPAHYKELHPSSLPSPSGTVVLNLLSEYKHIGKRARQKPAPLAAGPDHGKLPQQPAPTTPPQKLKGTCERAPKAICRLAFVQGSSLQDKDQIHLGNGHCKAFEGLGRNSWSQWGSPCKQNDWRLFLGDILQHQHLLGCRTTALQRHEWLRA